MEKSYVTMEQNLCVVCGKTFDSGAILLDTRLRNRFDMKTLTGWGMCSEHTKLRDEGYVALIGCDESLSTLEANGNLKPNDAYRTGSIVHLKEKAWKKVMNVPVPNKMICFCDEATIKLISSMRR